MYNVPAEIIMPGFCVLHLTADEASISIFLLQGIRRSRGPVIHLVRHMQMASPDTAFSPFYIPTHRLRLLCCLDPSFGSIHLESL